MSLVLNDRVRETTTIVGTGTATLLGAAAGYQSFSVIGNANTCYYTISDQAGTNWEVGIGTYVSATPALARTTVLKSSNAGALVSFSAGTKDVFVTYPAETAVSGGGGGTYPTVQPTLNLDFANSKTVDPRITFVRNSTATYYDGQTTAMAEQNLLTYSQDFRNTADAGSTRPWLYVDITNTYGAGIAPDGTTTTNYLQETATTAIHILASSAVNSINLGSTTALIYSIYFKKGLGLTAPDWIQINTGGASNCYASFNLTTGLVGNYGGGSGISATNPVNVGAGWYRCIITLATAGSGIHYFYPGFTNNTNPTSRYPSYLGVITSDVQAWGAQLEQRSTVTAYTPTTTAAITNYIPVLMTAAAGVPRLDYNPTTGQALGLLIEESRTNLLLYSSDFSNSYWSKANSTITPASGIAPDGTQTASLYVPNNGASIGPATNLYKQITLGAGVGIATSIYAKAKELIAFTLQDGNGNGAVFNLSTSTPVSFGSGVGSITSVGNGWYRCVVTMASSLANPALYFYPSGTANGFNGIFIWGAQLEAGAFATSYMPSVATTMTRAADQASMTGTNFSSWYNQAQGSFCIEVDSFAPNYTFLSILDWGINNGNRNTISFNNGFYNFSAVNNNVASMTCQVSVIRNNMLFSKLSVSFTNTTSFIWQNGTVTASSSAGTLYNSANMLLILGGRVNDYIAPINGHIRKLSYYPVALSSSNLVALTS